MAAVPAAEVWLRPGGVHRDHWRAATRVRRRGRDVEAEALHPEEEVKRQKAGFQVETVFAVFSSSR